METFTGKSGRMAGVPAYAEELEQYACRKRMEAEDEEQKTLQRCRQRKIPQNQKVAEKLH